MLHEKDLWDKSLDFNLIKDAAIIFLSITNSTFLLSAA
jgi:hypothetical protein